MKIVVFWFRRDLRLDDNTGLNAALRAGFPVLPVFIYDSDILQKTENAFDRRVDYFHQALVAINQTLITQYGSALYAKYGTVVQAFTRLVETFEIEAVYCNSDYEPDAIRRDREVKNFLLEKGISFFSFKDQVIFEENEIVKEDGTPYTVYTPYSHKWLSRINSVNFNIDTVDTPGFFRYSADYLSLEEIGFRKTGMRFIPPVIPEETIRNYHLNRDYPSCDGTTLLGMALRFGTVSIRKCVKVALELNHVWLKELIWREFFMQILYHFPHVEFRSFKPKYDFIVWRNDEKEFEKWCAGETGYALVDAGMRQLNETGFMHNRARMVAASFLCKHLLIDWRWGEAYFATILNDYDLAANNGNWQWAAGCGCDAAPYFRIFNPEIQLNKFDRELVYTSKWNPGHKSIPRIVKQDVARKRALETYAAALKN